MIMEAATQKDLPNGNHFVESQRCSWVYWFANGHQVRFQIFTFVLQAYSFQLVSMGTLSAQFDQHGKMDVLEIVATEHNEYIPRAGLVQTAAESPELKQSPNMSKAASKRQSKQKQQQPPQDQPPQIPIPESAVTDLGITQAIQQFLEVSVCTHLL